MGLGELLLCPPPLDLALARQLLALPKKGQRSALSSVEVVATSTASWQLRRRDSLDPFTGLPELVRTGWREPVDSEGEFRFSHGE